MFGTTQNGRGLTIAAVICTLSILATAAFAGPPKGKKPAPKTTAPTATEIAAGKKVYTASGCGGCHAISGNGGKAGPDLTKVGVSPKHTLKWLSDQVSDPKLHTPDSTMPGYAESIKGKDLKAIAAYLSTLKK